MKLLSGLLVEARAQPVSVISLFVSLCLSSSEEQQSEHSGLSRAAKNLKINERTSSGRKEVFCSAGCGVGKERRKRKTDESLTKLHVMFQPARCLRPRKFQSESAFTVLMCALKFLLKNKLFSDSVLKVLRWTLLRVTCKLIP